MWLMYAGIFEIVKLVASGQIQSGDILTISFIIAKGVLLLSALFMGGKLLLVGIDTMAVVRNKRSLMATMKILFRGQSVVSDSEIVKIMTITLQELLRPISIYKARRAAEEDRESMLELFKTLKDSSAAKDKV